MTDQQQDPSPGPSSASGPEKPSFTTFWKRSKEALITSRKITFVNNTGNSLEGAEAEAEAEHGSQSKKKDKKAAARRAQVRKAQIEHRQRKANYVKTLEMDVARIRDQIAREEREVLRLKGETDALRCRVQTQISRQPAGDLNSPLPPPPPTELLSRLDSMDWLLDGLDGIDDGGWLMSLDIDDVMNLPSYQITSPSSGIIHGRQGGNGDVGGGASGGQVGDGSDRMTAEETRAAINFILALEHVCWDHFHPQSSPHSQSGPQPGIDINPELVEGVESGHTLMATSLALRTAPSTVFESTIPHIKQSLRSKHPTEPHAVADGEGVSWQTEGLTLRSLYGLACSLNKDSEGLEITPVQAWFELTGRYPRELLLREDKIEEMKREFVGVVRCPHYGASMERGAFESIVYRVLGPSHTTDGDGGYTT
ncbi:hypothetical protein QBC46DRAFT_386247 [Diplogelasinospora grovesii]|uniref:BZIP domain-containing protein n=1 Tax=Diplogelasinospora grovesii TaxID=303347 RepID=A0AAN6S4V0_9PEZI|nr:hypothetical protein QBC46DRAFT_386247 [Diplogelasinospora grovesii]